MSNLAVLHLRDPKAVHFTYVDVVGKNQSNRCLEERPVAVGQHLGHRLGNDYHTTVVHYGTLWYIMVLKMFIY